ncbi:uncharacterized protein LOC122552459 isoform X1 [Chiloscyllium plagiosum]|uniref:uncharacterized protein LOC122552459 isoform X1 n=1 Tax=Chiloscyllium plagiosum TaxID=36176 RepID=UPI001CB87639|nr:uncharacterized protein LOC122552459 isoform X1 [Chiloscyllium plagiosum]XP_043551129.1 uncharacterized protein LOC122552459 isoform X1 [Chiloscyllium plagiosum]
MAAGGGYLLLLTCLVGQLPLELTHLPEKRIPPEENAHRQQNQISMEGRRSDPPPRLHGGHPRKVPQFPGGEQLKSNQLQLRRKRYNSHALHSVGDENRLKNEDAVTGHKEYYLPRPPPRMHPHVYEDPVNHGEEEVIRDGSREVIIPESSFGVTPHIYQDPAFRNEWGMNRRRGQTLNRMPHYESFEEIFTDLEDEKLRQASKHHNLEHEREHEREHEHRHEHKHEHRHEREHGPTIEHNNYWIVGQRRFRMIVIIILAVIVSFIVLLILTWFLLPKKNVKKVKKTSGKK